MSKALLITPAFWDPICPPLGTASLKSYAEISGHQIDIVDLNTNPQIFGAQREYFNEVQQQFPYTTTSFSVSSPPPPSLISKPASLKISG